MRLQLLAIAALSTVSLAAAAEDLTWRKDIQPIIDKHCVACHGDNAPFVEAWKLDQKNYEAKSIGPRLNTYPDFIRMAGWPDTGAVQRRLDDGKNAGGKPGNMYANLGDNDAERAKNLATIKAWLGEGAWNLNRWEARGNVPAVTKEQIDKIKAKY